jgi:ABC-type multidrug transport system fused ATPase/permease subunit
MGTKLQLLFMNLGSTVAGFIIAFFYSWKLTLVFLGGCFPMFGIMAGAMTMNENMSKTQATMYEKVGSRSSARQKAASRSHARCT